MPTLPTVAVLFVVAFVALRAVERHAGRVAAERLTAMRRLREWRPPQPPRREPPRLTSQYDPTTGAGAVVPWYETGTSSPQCSMHPVPGRQCTPHGRNPAFCYWCGKAMPQAGAA